MQRSSSAAIRSAFTLIELLVVIAIIAILIALLVPAVQKVREASARTQCTNNLKQLGIAAHAFHDANKFMVPAWIGDNSQDPDGWASWAVLLLPYLDQGPLYNMWDIRNLASTQPPAAYQAQLAVYRCPSRPVFVLSTGDFAAAGLGDYAACFGTDADGPNSNGAIIPIAAGSVTGSQVLKWRGQFGMQGIIDGTSNTLMFGEKHIRPTNLRGKNEDRSPFGGHNHSIRRMAGQGITTPADTFPLRGPTETGNNANASFGGPHPSMCMFVFCDGAVRSIPLNTDLTTLGRLVQRNDGQAMTIPQ